MAKRNKGTVGIVGLGNIGSAFARRVAAFVTNSGVSSLASAALPGNDRASFADRFFLSARNVESAALQPFKRYVMAKTAPALP